MKHTVTTYNTKKSLATSLKDAMRQKNFSKITVSEIIAICGVNRKTFYYHFEDIYALLKWMLEEEALEVVKHFDLLVNYEDAIRFVMRYVDENDYIISCAYDSIGREEMKRFFYADFVGVVASVIDSAEENLNKSIDPGFKAYDQMTDCRSDDDGIVRKTLAGVILLELSQLFAQYACQVGGYAGFLGYDKSLGHGRKIFGARGASLVYISGRKMGFLSSKNRVTAWKMLCGRGDAKRPGNYPGR